MLPNAFLELMGAGHCFQVESTGKMQSSGTDFVWKFLSGSGSMTNKS